MGTTAQIRCGCFALAALALASAALGQADIPTIRVSTDLIQVPVLAFRLPFRSAPGLGLGDLTIRLYGWPPFHPSYVRVEGAEPVGLSIVVDAESGQAEQLARSVQAAMRAWPTELLHGTDGLSFYVAGCRLMRSLDHAPADLALKRDFLVQAASSPLFQEALGGGPACTRPPIDYILQAVMDQSGTAYPWRVVLLLISGEKVFSIGSLERLRTVAAVRGVSLFAVKYFRQDGFPASASSNKEDLNRLVGSLGGLSVPSSYADLGIVTAAILRDIRERYILSFPRPDGGDAGRHLLEVKTTVRGVKLRASAASAPVVDSTPCADTSGSWVCPTQRPRYGVGKHWE